MLDCAALSIGVHGRCFHGCFHKGSSRERNSRVVGTVPEPSTLSAGNEGPSRGLLASVVPPKPRPRN
jgi:hypothetical protein